ncbi:3'-5' exonuclease [Amycolatopsis acidicola]|uniref:3'-5' exonuclease n=1 Tax=Amycolatopsis acidicola TaxID=2596893 RepID=A0A5N0VCI0_9PSEU|nr:3'-5' exonuclease [Amycolatopsis acidicola]
MPWRRSAPHTHLAVPWRDAAYCVVDLETTGLDLRRDEVVSFGTVIIRKGRIHCGSARYSRVRPPRKVTVGAMSVHGMRDQDLASAPSLREVAPGLRAELGGRVLVAHAAWVERAFIGRALGGSGRYMAPTIDTAALARAIGVAPSGTGYEPDIEAMAGDLGLYPHTPHHALGDALTTAEVFLALVSRIEGEKGPVSAAELVAISRRHTLT